MGYPESFESKGNKSMTFRFDDVCINADMQLIQRMTDYLFNEFYHCEVIYGVSPLVHRMLTGDPVKDQRVFPEMLNALSDYRHFFRVDMAGVPEIDPRVTRAGHGLIHVDHRLLSKEAQELSIVTSCSLVNASTFIPPFNKWNADTESVCQKNAIDLIKFEDGWLSMEHNKFTDGNLWYLHAREWTFEKFTTWFSDRI